MNLQEILDLDVTSIVEEKERLAIEIQIEKYLYFLKQEKNNKKLDEDVFNTYVAKFNSIRARFKNQRISAGILPKKKEYVKQEDTSPSVPNTHTLIHFDGSISKNPGGLAVGGCVAFLSDGNELTNYLTKDNSTNNEAEYLGLIAALELGLQYNLKKLYIKGDSQLVVKQVNHKFCARYNSLYPLYQKASLLTEQFEDVILVHVRRYFNKDANRFVYSKMKSLTLD